MHRKRRSSHSTARSMPATEPTPAAQATELEALARTYPQDREEILLEAAGIWRDAEEHDRALDLYQQLLDADDCQLPHLVEALRIDALWDAGRTDQAREAAQLLRRRHPTDAGAWNIIAEMFETGGELPDAAEWFTAGLTHILGPATPLTPAAVGASPVPSHDVEMLAVGRHRVRRRLGLPHDDGDRLADELHTQGSSLLNGTTELDELHDPARLDALESRDPDIVRAEIDKLTAEITARRAALARPRMTCALFWPSQQFVLLLDRWPQLADDYGTGHPEHVRRLERTLQQLSLDGGTHLGVARGAVEDFEEYTRDEGALPLAGATRAAYAADLAARGQATPWPPPRNHACWCESGRKYKKCCGNPALT